MALELCSTDTDSGWITVVEKTGDMTFRPCDRISVGNAPRGSVKFTTDGRGYVSNCAGDTISEIDSLTHRETARIKVGIAPRGIGIVPGDRYALVSNSGSNYVSIVDLNAREEVAQVAVGRDPRHMAVTPDGKSAYVCVWGAHYISKIDIEAVTEDRDCDFSREVREVRRIKIGDEAHPYSCAIDPKGRYLFVANTQSPIMTVIGLGDDKVAAKVDLGHKGARAVAFDAEGEIAFVSIEDTSEVAMVDVDDMKVVRRIDVGPGPRGIAFDPKENTLYASVFARPSSNLKRGAEFQGTPNTLTVVKLDRGTGLRKAKAEWHEVPVGKGPCSISVWRTE